MIDHFQKIDEMEQEVADAEAVVAEKKDALGNVEVVNAMAFLQSYQATSSAVSMFKANLEKIYDYVQGTWSDWCEANLTAEEKQEILTMLDTKVKDIL